MIEVFLSLQFMSAINYEFNGGEIFTEFWS